MLISAAFATPATTDTAHYQAPQLHSHAGAVFVGTRFLRDHPQWRSVKRLASVIRPDGISAHEPLNSRMAEDFALGRTVVVDGWLLSITEACVCGLVALRNEQVPGSPDAPHRAELT